MKKTVALLLIFISLSLTARAETYGSVDKTQPPDSLVLMLHPRCSDYQSMKKIAEAFAPSMQQTVFIIPNAPQNCDDGKFQWVVKGDELPALISGLDIMLATEMNRYGIRPGKAAVMGYSQGGGIGLILSLTDQKNIGAFLALSPTPSRSGIKNAKASKKPPLIRIIGGQNDKPVADGAIAQQIDMLQKAGFDVTYKFYEKTGHFLMTEHIVAEIPFLKQALYTMGPPLPPAAPAQPASEKQPATSK